MIAVINIQRQAVTYDQLIIGEMQKKNLQSYIDICPWKHILNVNYISTNDGKGLSIGKHYLNPSLYNFSVSGHMSSQIFMLVLRIVLYYKLLLVDNLPRMITNIISLFSSTFHICIPFPCFPLTVNYPSYAHCFPTH